MMRELSPQEWAMVRRDMNQRRIMMSTPARHRFEAVLQAAAEIPDADRAAFYALMADAAFNPKTYNLPEAQ